MNTSHQGALPAPAEAEALEAIAWKRSPRHMVGARFREVTDRLRHALGRLVQVPAEDIILTNGASYGVHLLANGLPLGAGDEVLLMAGDFPSNVLPWRGLAAKGAANGVRVRELASRRGLPVVEPEDVADAITERTRVVCLSWVHSFSGHALDLETLGSVCRERGVWLIANSSQGLGGRSLDLGALPVDAVVNVGWKWLCGPYGTGFCWLRPELRESLAVNRDYWLTAQTADDLEEGSGEAEDRADVGARRYDVFGTASFFNVKPFTASVETLLDIGLDRIEAHDRALVDRLVDGLLDDRHGGRWQLVSPERAEARTPVVVFTHRDPTRNRQVHDHLARAGIDIALRRGNLRASPHLHNGPDDVDRLLDALATASTPAA